MNADWLSATLAHPATQTVLNTGLGAVFGALIVKGWERARPVAFTESVDSTLKGDDAVIVDESFKQLFANTAYMAVPDAASIPVGLLAKKFPELHSAYQALAAATPELPGITLRCRNAATTDAKLQALADAIRYRAVTEIMFWALRTKRLFQNGS